MFGSVAYSEEYVFCSFKEKFNLKGKRVLEIGGSLPYETVVLSGVEEWYSVDPRNEDCEKNFYKTVKGKGSLINKQENHFDYVFSSNSFEHIEDLKETLDEAYRVLKKGGILYSHFGPIWSAPDGHHLDVIVSSEDLGFWNVKVLEDYSHLTYGREKLSEALSEQFSSAETDVIIEAVYNSSWLNRLSFEDYVEIFNNSNLSLVHLETSEKIDYVVPSKHINFDSNYIEATLSEKYSNKNVMCRDILVIMRK